MPGAPTIRRSRNWQAPGAVLARVVDRARGFHETRQGYFRSIRKPRCGCARFRGRMHRLRKDAAGKVTAVRCNYYADSKSERRVRTATSQRQHSTGFGEACLSVRSAALRPLVRVLAPGAGERVSCSTQSGCEKALSAAAEPALKQAAPEERFQFRAAWLLRRRRIDSKPPARRCSTARYPEDACKMTRRLETRGARFRRPRPSKRGESAAGASL